jgi:histidinol phosphatase-like enzyme (inositol monophosphatase family)
MSPAVGHEWERELDVVRRAVERAGRVALEHFGTALTVETKADASPVTVADRRAEEVLRAELAAAFPDDGLVGEELGVTPGTSGRRWIVDPIDGTQSFIRGVPLWGVLAGLEVGGRVVAGAAGLPALGETLWAAVGAGAWCNGRPARASGVRLLRDATVLTSDAGPRHFGEKWEGFQRLLKRAARHRGWGDAYGYALVATGRADVMLDPLLNPWDIAAFVPILTEAGAAFFDWNGAESIHGGCGIGAVAALRDEILDVLRVR